MGIAAPQLLIGVLVRGAHPTGMVVLICCRVRIAHQFLSTTAKHLPQSDLVQAGHNTPVTVHPTLADRA